MAARSYACLKAGVVDNVIVLDDAQPFDPDYLAHMAAAWDSIVPVDTLVGVVEPGAMKVGAKWVGRTDPTNPRFVPPELVDKIAAVSIAMQQAGVPAASIPKAIVAIRSVFGG